MLDPFRIFESADDVHQEAGAGGAVENAVVAGERERAEVVGGERSDGEDRGLRWDDECAEAADSERAEVRRW